MRQTLVVVRFIVIIVLVLGVTFRSINIDKKVYWGDETYTSLRISGYTIKDVSKEFVNNQLLTNKDIKEYQQINTRKSLSDTIHGLATEEPQFPPVYFALVRFWVNIFGDSIAVTRSFSVIISLLIFPLTYWLCLELFNSSLVGWIAMLIMAISPFHVLYAQEARPYSLWTITILLSSASFFRALRLQNKLSWGIYTVTMIFGLYTYLLNILLVATHASYLFIIERFKFSKSFINYLLASILSLVIFLPWIGIILMNYSSFQETSDWALESTSLSILLSEWTRNISYSFMDFWYYFTYVPDSALNLKFAVYLIPTILLLVGYAIYFLCRHTPPKIWLFILILMATNALPLMLPDLIKGGYRSIMPRYFVPCYIGMQLSVSYLFAIKIIPVNQKILSANVWKLLLSTLILGGIISCGVSSQTESWWNKRTTSYDQIFIARLVSEYPDSLLIMQSNFGTIASLSHLIKSDITYQVFNDEAALKISANFKHKYLLQSAQLSIDKLKEQQGLQLKLIYQGRKQSLWQIS